MLGGCGGQCAGVELLVTSLEKNVVGRRLDATTALKQQHAQREGGGETWPLADPHRRPILTGGGTHNEMKLRFGRPSTSLRQHSALPSFSLSVRYAI